MGYTNSNAARAAQLGMPFGTATHRLRKAIMFKYVQMAGHDTCFRCALPIKTVDELSIEHKLPWQGRDTERFWDLDNIAFSHLKCNLPNEYNTAPGRIASNRNRKQRLDDITNAGLAWCGKHQEYLPVGRFNLNGYNRNGVQDICKECRSEYRSKG